MKQAGAVSHPEGKVCHPEGFQPEQSGPGGAVVRILILSLASKDPAGKAHPDALSSVSLW